MIPGLVWDEWDHIIVCPIFGSDRSEDCAAMVRAFVREHLGAEAEIISCELSAGAAVGLELAGGRKVFLKAWPSDRDPQRLKAQVAVQAALAVGGYPAPSVLAGVAPLGLGQAVVMAHDRSGEAVDVRAPGVRDAMARGLRVFIEAAKGLRIDPVLPSWRPQPAEPLWAPTHSPLFNFEKTRHGAEWIDAIAAKARERLMQAQGEDVLGHGDWSAKNMRIAEDRICAVYDWDSVMRGPETFAVGAAVAHFPMTWELPVPGTPGIPEMVAFIAAYEAARGKRFSHAESEEIAAQATFYRAYKARCEHCGDPDRAEWAGSSRERLWDTGGYSAQMLGG